MKNITNLEMNIVVGGVSITCECTDSNAISAYDNTTKTMRITDFNTYGSAHQENLKAYYTSVCKSFKDFISLEKSYDCQVKFSTPDEVISI